MADPKSADIHIFFLPFPARGHTIPLVDAAILFARRGGVRCTVVTTPGNSGYTRGTITRARDAEGLPIDLELVPFPSADVGLPEGVECSDVLLPGPDVMSRFRRGVDLLRHPIEELAADRRPDCIVADQLLVMAVDLAESLSVPRIRFSIFPPFTTAVIDNILMTGAAGSCPNLGDLVRPAGLPCPLRFTGEDLPPILRSPGFMERAREEQRRSCGVLFNSFEELEPEYVEHYRKVNLTGRPMNVWCIGPVQLYKCLSADGVDWGTTTVKDWLDSKPPESVVHISFGSEGCFSQEQLREIALGLQGCAHPFIWVVRGNGGGAEAMDEWLPAGFRSAVGDRGVILTEWAPQVAILNHPSVGGFVTHCGWNSTLEAVCAGLPVVGWPLHSDQFLNERYLVEVMRVGVRILEGPGMRSAEPEGKEIVRGDLIKNAIDRLMDGSDEEPVAMRRAAKKYSELARSATESGGSSFADLGSVIDHMNMLAKEKISSSGSCLPR